MKKRNKNGNVPNLRFPEFQSLEWERKTLDNLCNEFKSGKNIRADEITENGSFPVFGGNGLRGFSDQFNYNGEFVLIGRQGALCGNVRIIQGKCYMTEHAIVVHANEKNSTKFLLFLLDKMNLGQYSDQSAQPGLAVNKLLKIAAKVPNLQEQEKIARFLTLIDERISTQSKIIEKYESLIKTMVDNIFFQKIRFSNENNKPFSSWNRFYLKEIGEISSNGVDKTINSSEKKINLLNYMDIYNAINVTPENVEKLMQVTASATQIEEKNVSKGDFFFTPSSETRDDICKCNEILYDLSDTVYSYHIVRFRPKTNYFSLGFGKFCFNSTLFRKQMITACQGVQRFALSIPAFENAYVELPSIQEQEKISGFLMGIEKKILVEKEILLNYRQQKSYFMRQMFI